MERGGSALYGVWWPFSIIERSMASEQTGWYTLDGVSVENARTKNIDLIKVFNVRVVRLINFSMYN